MRPHTPRRPRLLEPRWFAKTLLLHPPYSLVPPCAAEITGIAAADIVHDFLSMLLSSKPPTPHSLFAPAKDEL